jgi:hypothetical protein
MDSLKSILDPFLPPNVVLLKTEFDLNNYKGQKIDPENIVLVNKATRFLFEERVQTNINQQFNFLMQ